MAEISRRTFIKGSCAVLLTNFSFAAPLKSENVDTVIYDLNLKGSSEYAKSFADSKKFAINGDISDVYFDLKNDLKNKQIISGLTSKETFFVVENIAKDYGYTAQNLKHDELISWILVPNLKRS